MDYYESTCQSCGHKWQWTGYKSAWNEEQARAKRAQEAKESVCPRCKGAATIGLDHTSPEAREMDGFLGSVLGSVLGPKVTPTVSGEEPPRGVTSRTETPMARIPGTCLSDDTPSEKEQLRAQVPHRSTDGAAFSHLLRVKLRVYSGSSVRNGAETLRNGRVERVTVGPARYENQGSFKVGDRVRVVEPPPGLTAVGVVEEDCPEEGGVIVTHSRTFMQRLQEEPPESWGYHYHEIVKF